MIQMTKKHIYIILMYSPTIPSRLVKLFTKYKYSHVGICLNKDCETIYSFGRKSLHNFFNGGFTIENKNMPFYAKFKQTICRIYELEISLTQYQKIKEKLKYMEQNSKIFKYDFFGIILREFKIPITFKNHYVCSQFVAELLEEFKIVHFKKKICFIKPIDFEKITDMKEIYSGNYRLYTQ